MTAKIKAAWMLDTSEAASKTRCKISIPTTSESRRIEILEAVNFEHEYELLRHQFSELGFDLRGPSVMTDDRPVFGLTRHGKSLNFHSINGLQDYLMGC